MHFLLEQVEFTLQINFHCRQDKGIVVPLRHPVAYGFDIVSYVWLVFENCFLRTLDLVGIDPFLWGEDVVCSSRTFANITSESGGEYQWFVRIENSEHILDESTDFVGFALFFVIDVLEVSNCVHNFLEATFQFLFGVFQNSQ